MENVVKVLFLIVIIQTCAWLLWLFIKNNILIDIFWVISITTASVYLIGIKDLAQLFLLSLWSLRLGLWLLCRAFYKNNDPRYLELSKNKKPYVFYFFNLQLQGLFAMVIVTPFYFTKDIYLSTTVALPHLLTLIGIVISHFADLQLAQHKKQSKALMNRKLWSYSRHPNYAGELLVWLGFAITNLNSIYSYIGLISPLILLFIMKQFTIPITERLMSNKYENFEKYKNNTYSLFPYII